MKPKVCAFAFDDDPGSTAHGIAHHGQTFRQRVDILVGEEEGLIPAPPNGDELHQGLIVTGWVDSDTYVIGLVVVDEE